MESGRMEGIRVNGAERAGVEGNHKSTVVSAAGDEVHYVGRQRHGRREARLLLHGHMQSQALALSLQLAACLQEDLGPTSKVHLCIPWLAREHSSALAHRLLLHSMTDLG